jgi:hypothetical protein
VFTKLFVHSRVFCGCCLLAVGIAGCGQTDPARAPIAGRVTVGGQPLAKGRILFIPQAPNQGPATTAAIVAGEYKVPKTEGAVVGPNRVEVEADLNLGFELDDEAAYVKRGGRPLPLNSIPPQYNRNSTLLADVKAREENRYDVTIPGVRDTVQQPQR